MRTTALDQRNSTQLDSLDINKKIINSTNKGVVMHKGKNKIVMISTFPPRECGLATYTQDLTNAISGLYEDSLQIPLCAVDAPDSKLVYNKDEVKWTLNTESAASYSQMAEVINTDTTIKAVMIQHEFGLHPNFELFEAFITAIEKPITYTFHTVLPEPDDRMKLHIQNIADTAHAIVVMTNSSEELLQRVFKIDPQKITVIPHGTHLVAYDNKDSLKMKYGFEGKKVLSTFGLLGPNKCVETTLKALPAVIKNHKDVHFLIIGKTHPVLLKEQGESYRNSLKAIITDLKLQDYVTFIDEFVELQKLLEILQMSDLYVFTSCDPNQAVSGTFSYAVSCGCPIISTPIPHAKEVLQKKPWSIV